MARLTVNEAGASGYTDELILTPNDFTTAAGNTTTVVNFPVKAGDLIDAVALVKTEAFSTSSNITIGPDANAVDGGSTADPDGFIEATNANATGTLVNTGDLVDDGGGAGENRFKVHTDGNITITSVSALDGDSQGKMRVLFSVKRTNF
jgi:hypothetical protein|tara:strand:+ start:983 stop:1429 length:447 start_codon:yes stop_codon:yes gene_type:complete